ncbi:N-acetylglucosamine-6-phosphate deacetylase [Planctomonas psychrotolerans]|uniref:N-acetylglucosamine-6-phosphate deacetylase n=1 Tax=Planctomonas psychrotolerans TaxID=2528712 RepID=UPI00123BB4C5|nr:amidohydrolase family protein [Planctomonas psychrotolerans]
MSGELVIGADRLVDGSGFDGPGWLSVRDGVVADRGTGTSTAPVDVQLGTVVPGFLDAHVHGAVGIDFGALGADPSPAIAHHARTGSTTLVASLATSALSITVDRLRELAPVVRSGALAGLHLEGPFLASERRGAHDPALLLAPDPAAVDALLAAADGTLAMITLAPELPGAMQAIRRLTDSGVVVALGHTAATVEEMRRGIDAGATVITHVFNGMPSLHHRAPGPVGVALTDERLTVEVIGDGHHLDDIAVDLVRSSARGRMTLVSDAMSATGLGDGHYDLGSSSVVVENGVASLADHSSLAGGTTPIGGAVTRLVRRGADAVEVASLTSAAPARALGRRASALTVGAPADLVELGDDGVTRVMKAGAWLA